MKTLGGFLIVVGLIWGVVSFNINTSVAVGGQSYGSGDYSFTVPKSRVNNLGLMNDKQNHIIGAGLTLVIGVMLFIFGSRKEDEVIKENKKNKQQNSIKEDFKNNTYIFTIDIDENINFKSIKENTNIFYTDKGFIDIKIDKENSYMIKTNDGKSYIQIENKNDRILFQAFNTVRPDFIDTLNKKDNTDIKAKENTTDKLINLANMLEKGLISEDEFKKLKADMIDKA